jgi:hypothetical protein
MASLCSRCSTKVLRPERCVILDGKPCAACAEDIELEKEIQELEIMIDKIHIRRRELRTAMNKNHDRFIPKFPPEIASHIFAQYSPPSTFFKKYDYDNPLYLGAVCQKWRQLAWATPELWTSLHVVPYKKYYLADLPKLATEWLERSASLPLTIRLQDHWGWVDKDDGVINILNTHSARWHDMHFDLPARHLHRFSGSSQENILRRVLLCQPSDSPWPRGFSTFSMQSKPMLTDLRLMSVNLQYADIIWNNLTVASVYDLGVDECFELIRRAPLLETLTLQAINPSSDVFPIPNTRIIHLHLHSLELWGFKEETMVTGILDLLCLPSLEQWIHDLSPLPLDSMISFIGCLSSCLTIFKISIDEIDYHQVTRLLSNLSSLKVLELRAVDRPPTDDFFSLLCSSAQSPLYLPHLQSLNFLCAYDFPWLSLPQIFDLSRWQTLRVKVNTQLSYLDCKIAKLFLELVDKGVDLRIINDWPWPYQYTDLLQAYKKRQLSYTNS